MNKSVPFSKFIARVSPSALKQWNEDLKRKDLIVIDKGQCLSQRAAEEFIGKLEL
jgi:hypothetical protein